MTDDVGAPVRLVTIPGSYGTIANEQRPISITVPEDLAPEDALEVFNFVYKALFGLRTAQAERAKRKIVTARFVPPVARG